MHGEIGGLSKRFAAVLAFEGFLSRVRPIVNEKTRRLRKTFLALNALLRPFAAVRSLMDL